MQTVLMQTVLVTKQIIQCVSLVRAMTNQMKELVLNPEML